MDDEQAEFVDRLGLFFETLGASRTMGRLYGWLMICDPPERSLTELTEQLRISKASASTTVRSMVDAGLIERTPSSGRRHQYRVAPGGWTRVLRVQFAGLHEGSSAVDYGLSIVPEDGGPQRERIEDFRLFLDFAIQDGEDFIRRWEQYREQRSKV